MAAYYDVVDPIGGLAAGPPYWSYTKVFQGNANFMSDTMFLMWVRTLYKSLAESASVRVNGQEIGKLNPRPFPYLPPGETRTTLPSTLCRSSFHVPSCLEVHTSGLPSTTPWKSCL